MMVAVLIATGQATGQSRLESEFKLVVPSDQREAIWEYLSQAYGPNGRVLKQLGPNFSATFATDEFLDRYFDTPRLPLFDSNSGLRHRTRHVVQGVDRSKDGRQLVQLKLGTEDQSGVVREEIKFKTRKNPGKTRDNDDQLPCLGLVKRSERRALRTHLSTLSIEPRDLTEVATLFQVRQRTYISENGQPFATITLDRVMGRRWIYTISFDEMELELNEMAFTEADEAGRERMTRLNTLMKEDLFANFPDLKQDQTPKYNKAVNLLREKDPFFQESLTWGGRPEFLLLIPLLLMGWAVRKFWRHRASETES